MLAMHLDSINASGGHSFSESGSWRPHPPLSDEQIFELDLKRFYHRANSLYYHRGRDVFLHYRLRVMGIFDSILASETTPD